MSNLFLPVLKMSVTGGVVILAVMLIRLFLRRSPKIYSYILWVVAAFRLLCPASFTSDISFFKYVDQPAPVVTAESVSAVITEQKTDPMGALSAVWFSGIVILVIYSIASYYRLKIRLKDAEHMYDNIYCAEGLPSPFVMGFTLPVIYIPTGLTDREREYVLKHEYVHIKRRDHIIKLIAFGILSIHWFNPLCWLAFILMSRDMEMSCDERVLRDGNSIKLYGKALLSMATASRFPSPGPISFGEVGVKRRIKNILSWKKPAVWITIISVVLCIGTVSVFATDAKKDIPYPPFQEEIPESMPDTYELKGTDTSAIDTTTIDTTTIDTTTIETTAIDTTTVNTTAAYVYIPSETEPLPFTEEDIERMKSQLEEHQEWVHESIKADVSEWYREHPEVDPTKNSFIKNGWD